MGLRSARRGLLAQACAAAVLVGCWLATRSASAFASGLLSSAQSGAARTAGPRALRAVSTDTETDAQLAVQTRPGEGKRLLVLGGNGYVGREVCRLAVQRGYQVTSLSRRGENPEPDDPQLQAVSWKKGDAADLGTVNQYVGESDAVVHAIGLLFDSKSGLTNLNLIVSGSGSTPTEESTYDRVTRQTAFNLIQAVRSKFRMPFSSPTPMLFVSAAEAGWPDVAGGDAVEGVAPEWLRQYLAAKRAVESEIQATPDTIRPVIFRPSLIWSWTKFDVLPVIPIFNLANALGVPFVDKTVTVSTLSKAIIAGLEDPDVSGVQRFPEMEDLERRVA